MLTFKTSLCVQNTLIQKHVFLRILIRINKITKEEAKATSEAVWGEARRAMDGSVQVV